MGSLKVSRPVLGLGGWGGVERGRRPVTSYGPGGKWPCPLSTRCWGAVQLWLLLGQLGGRLGGLLQASLVLVLALGGPSWRLGQFI